MRLERFALTQMGNMADARLDAFTGDYLDGKTCPAYRLNIDCPDREMTLDELAVCVRSIREFLDGILICTEGGKNPAYVHPCIRSFEDSFAEDH